MIKEYATKYKVCPFKLSLDVSLWVDCVICDYNYVFDPRVYLRRFFSEGIDLQGKRLVGVAVVGVGHPKICLERNIIKYNFEEQKSQGYAYAYIYPGMIKVLQAAGRTIRSHTDKGVVLLIGDL